MTTYHLFGGHHYYPSGGMRDYLGNFASASAAMEGFDAIRQKDPYDGQWGHIVQQGDDGVLVPIMQAVAKDPWTYTYSGEVAWEPWEDW